MQDKFRLYRRPNRDWPVCGRNANRVTLPMEYYEAARDKKLIDFQAAAANIQAA